MWDLLKARWKHGYQAVPNPRAARVNESFRGLPLIPAEMAPDELSRCRSVCPSGAFSGDSPAMDLGRCVFCGACVRCLNRPDFRFSNSHYLSASSRAKLIVDPTMDETNYRRRAFDPLADIFKIFKRSLKLRSVSAAGCNGCEMELNACGNPNFDMHRYGVEVVASPRHADGLILSGPISANMAPALLGTWEAIPSPKMLILLGSCAISGGVFSSSPALERSFLNEHTPALYIPGCPPHPLTVINGILDWLGAKC